MMIIFHKIWLSHRFSTSWFYVEQEWNETAYGVLIGWLMELTNKNAQCGFVSISFNEKQTRTKDTVLMTDLVKVLQIDESISIFFKYFQLLYFKIKYSTL